MHDTVKFTEVKTALRYTSEVQVAIDCNVGRDFVRKVRLTNKWVKAKNRKKKDVAGRRARVKSLWSKVSKKGSREWKTHSSAGEIQTQLRVQHNIRVNRRTVARDLRHLNFRPRVRKCAPSRTRACLDKQLKFHEMCKAKKIDSKNLLFSDEAWVTCLERTGRIQWVRSNELPFPREKGDVRNYPRLMVWASVGVGYKSPLIILPRWADASKKKGYTLNAERYIETCLEAIKVAEAAEGKFFLQDGARCHTAKLTQAWHAENGVEVVQNAPYSPNFNCIEMVWKLLHAKIGAQCPLTEEELRTEAIKAWDAIEQSVIDKICGHFDTEMKKMAKKK